MVPTIIPRPQHTISRTNISDAALKVLYKLKEAGFPAYLVGGGVRDLLLGREPKDFDVATAATPEQVRATFRNSRLIGKRFRLAHVYFGSEIIEVATFRGTGDGLATTSLKTANNQGRLFSNGMIIRDNTYGTIEEDALRRDFTINSLYYNIADFSVLDFVGGIQDLSTGRLRLIGDPEQRYREDPVRMLRALRFSCKLGFYLDQDCEAPLTFLGHMLREVPGARLFDEILKLFTFGTGLNAFEKLRHYGLFKYLFAQTEASLTNQEHDFPLTLVQRGLAEVDSRVQSGYRISPIFMLAFLLWEPVRLLQARLERSGISPDLAIRQASSEVLSQQTRQISISKRLAMQVREVWYAQQRFSLRKGKRPIRATGHPDFLDAYSLLLLRVAAGEEDEAVANWWTKFLHKKRKNSDVPGFDSMSLSSESNL